ncbi:tissue factor-like [Engraulis encrasicolus]|uniref:tissue factor-like n=1 Tax=Engraulis encrasicolus TaxID=184585 RepID=UPI002FD48DC7
MFKATLLQFTVFALTLISAISGQNYPPAAQNVSWFSFNFKTILTWSPKPTNYAYTVEYSGLLENKAMHCIRTRETECDMTNQLLDLRKTYTADVISETLGSGDADFDELPYTSAPPFCPYKETQIGKPSFKVVQSAEDKTRMEVHIQDPLTAVERDGKKLTIREIFGTDLMYEIHYSKAGSTGKSKSKSAGRVVEIQKLEAGVSYCFQVAAHIRSRHHKTGQWAGPVCWPPQPPSFFEDVSWPVLTGGAAILLLVFVLLIVITVLCCKKCRHSKHVKMDAATMATTTV